MCFQKGGIESTDSVEEVMEDGREPFSKEEPLGKVGISETLSQVMTVDPSRVNERSYEEPGSPWEILWEV